VVGWLGWGRPLHASRLTPDEQYTHISMWCMLSAPLLLGCDLGQLDPFTLNLLTNDEVLAVNQDALGKQAVCADTLGPVAVYMKELEDGSRVLGFFNHGKEAATANFDKLPMLGLTGTLQARDLWRQKDLGVVKDTIQATVAPHGVVLIKVTGAEK
jgi:alpha-galactosidase